MTGSTNPELTNSAGMPISEEAKRIHQTDNSPRPEDGPQDEVSQDPEWRP